MVLWMQRDQAALPDEFMQAAAAAARLPQHRVCTMCQVQRCIHREPWNGAALSPCPGRPSAR